MRITIDFILEFLPTFIAMYCIGLKRDMNWKSFLLKLIGVKIKQKNNVIVVALSMTTARRNSKSSIRA